MLKIDGTEYPTKALMINDAPFYVILGISFLVGFQPVVVPLVTITDTFNVVVFNLAPESCLPPYSSRIQ